MKRSFLIFAVALLLSFFSFSAKAQFGDPNAEEITYEMPKPVTPNWVSDKGYWVVKSNQKTPKESTVYFYNNEHTMVYQEEIKNQKLKLKKKTLIKLKAALEEAVDSYQKGIWASRNEIVLQHLQR